MTNFNFTDRASYMAFRKQWKTRYAELTLDIRTTRAAIKQAYREGDSDRAGSLQSHKQYLRNDARDMLASLADAKVEAQRQYLAEREAADQIKQAA
jgi:hypothetical protein